MADRVELLEAALDTRPDGIALLDIDGVVAFWNRAAEVLTGYSGDEVTGRGLPDSLAALMLGEALDEVLASGPQPGQSALVAVRHKSGHSFDAIGRRVQLLDGEGRRIGMALVFHSSASLEALPHGEMPDGERLEESQADFEERMQAEFEDAAQCGQPFGLLWINVDQAHDLHKTHGVAACQAMLAKVRHALAQGMRPTEELGRWGADEFLIVSHERTAEMLLAHARTLAGQARTADFRWWGDRVSITVSIGAAHRSDGSSDTLAQLLERARTAMETSTSTGGNNVTAALPLHAAELAEKELNSAERGSPQGFTGGN